MHDMKELRLGRARSLTAGTLLALALAGALSVLVVAWYRLSMGCPGYDDEGTIRAPRSPQGRLVCSDGGLGEARITLLVAAGVVLWLLALVLWLRTRRFTWLVPLLVLVVASRQPGPDSDGRDPFARGMHEEAVAGIRRRRVRARRRNALGGVIPGQVVQPDDACRLLDC